MNIDIDDSKFRFKLQEYKKLTGKSTKEVLLEQVKLLAKRLMDLTFPFSSKQGKKRVAIDLGKVYLANSWFEEKFQFRNQKLGERVKNLVRSKDQSALEEVFEKSDRLSKIHIEAFDPRRAEKARKNGRVTYPAPYSFPLAEQGRVKQLVRKKQANVGLAKSGWGYCLKLLGGRVPGWLSKTVGAVIDKSGLPAKAFITITNKVGYFASLDSRAKIVSRAMTGRAQAMIKSAERSLKRAGKSAGF